MSRLLPYTQLKRAYQKSPVWLQRAVSWLPPGVRAGRKYRETRHLLEETQYADPEVVKKAQQARLQHLLTHAAKQVPYYRELFSSQSSLPSPGTIELHQLSELPLISKSLIQERGSDFIAQGGMDEPTYEDNTGGSSGTPFSFRKNNSMYAIELACMHDQWARVGYRTFDRKITLRGRTFTGRAPGKRWIHNPIYNELVLSTYHINEETVRSSLGEAAKFCPRFLHGYPSAITAFLELIERAGLPAITGIHAVLCGSEPVYEHQRNYIEQSLGAKVYSWYGQSECVLLAGECEHSRDYHSFPLYGLLELIDESGAIITEPGVEGEIVGTSLNNFAMPFIRYRTADRGILAEGPCLCGRTGPRLKSVTGRTQHYIYTIDHTRVPVTAFVFGQHFHAFAHIRGLQLVQRDPGRIVARIRCGDRFSPTDECELRDKMRASVDGRIHVDFEYVDSFPVNAAGKLDFVIQHVTEALK